MKSFKLFNNTLLEEGEKQRMNKKYLFLKGSKLLWTTEAGSENLRWTCRRHLNLKGKFLKKGMEKGSRSEENSIPWRGAGFPHSSESQAR